MCLSKAQFPWKSRVLDGTSRRRASSSVVPGDKDHSCPGFGNACRDGSHACLRYKLYRDPCVFISTLTVIDKLRQILNGVDIVVRRRRDQTHSRCRVTCLCHPWVNLSARQMTSFSRLCPLRHLDLNLPGAYQIAACYAKTA